MVPPVAEYMSLRRTDLSCMRFSKTSLPFRWIRQAVSIIFKNQAITGNVAQLDQLSSCAISHLGRP